MEERTLTDEGLTGASDAGWGLRSGETVGCFRVLRPLGRGGMGEVYEVEHVHLLKRYALKLLVGGDGELVARFRREARIMADMRHPNLVAVHAFEVDVARGRCYLIMDFVVGPARSGAAPEASRRLPCGDVWLGDSCSLADWLPQFGHRLDERRVRQLALEVCGALRYAHAFDGGGVVHRDLKPSNILLDAGGHAIVSDFGVAKVLGAAWRRAPESVSQDGAETYASRILGTAEYMAPEQRMGWAVSPRTDLYALGVIIYSLLVGCLPTGSWKVPSKCGVGCSREWDQIVCRCLAFDPEARYADASELSQALEAVRLLSDGACARRRAARWITAGVSVMALAGVGGLMLPMRPQHHPTLGGSPFGDSGGTSVNWRVSLVGVDSVAKARLARVFDGKPLTDWRPRLGDRDAALSLDLGDVREIGGITCQMPPAARLGAAEGSPVAVEVAASRDGVFWNVVAGALSPALEGADGRFSFERPVSGRYVKICFLNATRGDSAVVPELGFLLADGKKVRLHL